MRKLHTKGARLFFRVLSSITAMASRDNDDGTSSGAPGEGEGCCAKLTREPAVPTKLADLRARWLMLFLLCTTLVGSYWCYDLPAATQNSLADYFSDGDASVDDDGTNTDTSSFSFKYNLLYSVYSWPNIILPVRAHTRACARAHAAAHAHMHRACQLGGCARRPARPAAHARCHRSASRRVTHTHGLTPRRRRAHPTPRVNPPHTPPTPRVHARSSLAGTCPTSLACA